MEKTDGYTDKGCGEARGGARTVAVRSAARDAYEAVGDGETAGGGGGGGGGACMQVAGDAIRLSVKAAPGSSRSRLMDAREGRLRVAIAAAPEHGKANAELRDFFAKLLGCPKKSVAVISGEKSRLKTLALPLSAKEKLEDLLENL